MKVHVLGKPQNELEWWEIKLLNRLSAIQGKVVVFYSEEHSDTLKVRYPLNVKRIVWFLARQFDKIFFSIPKLHCELEGCIEFVCIKVESSRWVDRIDPESIRRIKSYSCDYLIRLGFGILKGEVLQISGGVLSLHHGDNRKYIGGPAGFWEVIYREKYVGVTLQLINENLDKGEVLARAEITNYYNYSKNQFHLKKQGLELLVAFIQGRAVQNDLVQVSADKNVSILRTPNIVYSFYVCRLFESNYWRYVRSFHYNVLNRRWRIDSLDYMEYPSISFGEFLADPIVYSNNLFVEYYSKAYGRGIIARKINDN